MSTRLRTGTLLALLAILGGAGDASGQALEQAAVTRSGGSDTVVVSLAAAERLALRHHPTIRAAELDLAVSETRRAQARRARFLPKVQLRNIWGAIPRARGEFTEFGVLVSPDTSTSFSDLRWFTQVDLDLVQPLYTFGRIGGLIDAADAGLEASRAGLETSSSDIRYQVRQLYWGVVLGEELLALAEDVQNKLAEADSTLDERYEDGSASQNDLFRFEIFEYRVRKQHREARDGLEMAREGLRAAIGLDADVPIKVDAEELSALEAEVMELDRYMDMAFSHRPELDQLRSGIQARHSLVRSRRGEMWPQLFLGGQIKWNRAPSRFDPKNPFVRNPTNFFNPGVVVGFTWNLNLGQTRDEMRLAQYEESRLRSQLDPLTEKIRLDVRKAYLDVVRAREDVDDSQNALTTSENWYRAESQTFDLGLGDIQDLVVAFQANVEMRTEHLRTVFVYNTSLAKLSRAVGVDVYGGGS